MSVLKGACVQKSPMLGKSELFIQLLAFFQPKQELHLQRRKNNSNVMAANPPVAYFFSSFFHIMDI